eukprot:2442754-Rhodomonas_salina.1
MQRGFSGGQPGKAQSRNTPCLAHCAGTDAASGVVDNPDQRIVSDVESFTTASLGFMVTFLGACWLCCRLSGCAADDADADAAAFA